MKPFAYIAPTTVRETARVLSATRGETEVLAGGTDLVTCLKQGLTQPQRVVSLRNVAALRGIETRGRQLRIGAMASLREVAAHAAVRQHFPSLVTAVEGIGSAQMINMGTVGGDLCQRPRCWYFRNGLGLVGGAGSPAPARAGDNRYHAIFANDGPAVFVSPSSLGPALAALGAVIVIAGKGGRTRKIPAASFFKAPTTAADRETVLGPDELLVEVLVPMKGLRNATYEIRHRFGLDWPYVTASVAYELKSGLISKPVVVLGQVAPTPWVATAAAAALEGAAVNAMSATRAGDAAVQGATPLSRNGYKVAMVRAAVRRAVLAAAV